MQGLQGLQGLQGAMHHHPAVGQGGHVMMGGHGAMQGQVLMGMQHGHGGMAGGGMMMSGLSHGHGSMGAMGPGMMLAADGSAIAMAPMVHSAYVPTLEVGGCTRCMQFTRISKAPGFWFHFNR
jgi:hypothetical protein